MVPLEAPPHHIPSLTVLPSEMRQACWASLGSSPGECRATHFSIIDKSQASAGCHQELHPPTVLQEDMLLNHRLLTHQLHTSNSTLNLRACHNTARFSLPDQKTLKKKVTFDSQKKFTLYHLQFDVKEKKANMKGKIEIQMDPRLRPHTSVVLCHTAPAHLTSDSSAEIKGPR